MKETHKMFEYTIECKREMMCWIYNISDKFEVQKDLGDNIFQVFFNTHMSRTEFIDSYGELEGWSFIESLPLQVPVCSM